VPGVTGRGGGGAVMMMCRGAVFAGVVLISVAKAEFFSSSFFAGFLFWTGGGGCVYRERLSLCAGAKGWRHLSSKRTTNWPPITEFSMRYFFSPPTTTTWQRAGVETPFFFLSPAHYICVGDTSGGEKKSRSTHSTRTTSSRVDDQIRLRSVLPNNICILIIGRKNYFLKTTIFDMVKFIY